MLRRDIACFAAIHARQTLEPFAAADVTEAGILKTDGREFPKSRELGQSGQRLVVNFPAADTKSPECRHPRECAESTAAEVRTDAAPDSFDRLGLAQRDKSVVCSDGFLDPQSAQTRHGCDMGHGGVIAEFAV